VKLNEQPLYGQTQHEFLIQEGCLLGGTSYEQPLGRQEALPRRRRHAPRGRCCDGLPPLVILHTHTTIESPPSQSQFPPPLSNPQSQHFHFPPSTTQSGTPPPAHRSPGPLTLQIPCRKHPIHTRLHRPLLHQHVPCLVQFHLPPHDKKQQPRLLKRLRSRAAQALSS